MKNEVVALFPITPASNMGEWADGWAAAGVKDGDHSDVRFDINPKRIAKR